MGLRYYFLMVFSYGSLVIACIYALIMLIRFKKVLQFIKDVRYILTPFR